MALSKKEISRRLFLWHTAKSIKQEYLQKTDEDKYFYKCCNAYYCSNCHGYGSPLRYIEGPGYICKKCWLSIPLCTVSGCNQVGLKDCDGQCRAHYFDYETDEALYRAEALQRVYERDPSFHDEQLINNPVGFGVQSQEAVYRACNKFLEEAQRNPERYGVRRIETNQEKR